MNETGRRWRVAIVGGGIAGIAAAYFLKDSGAEVTVLEAAPRIGGKLAVSEVAGVAVDAGAEALLARRPEGTGLIRAAGLGDQLVYPGTTAARIWTRGQFRPLPRRQFMGVPADLDDLARSGILSAGGLDRARQDAVLPPTGRAGDVAAGEYVGARFGPEVVDRLVDPLLGGVYAGRADQLSFEATLPALAGAAGAHRSLAEAAASLLPPPPPAGPGQAGPGQAGAGQAGAGQAGASQPLAPVFTTLAGG
ncbi:MAG: protoporphyrinogen oxidase, partial [Streptosporangiaceae bacterium]